jgi:hypothetical protein
MGTAGTILLVLGAWLVGSLLLGLLVGRMLRYGNLRPQPRPDPRQDQREDPHPDSGPDDAEQPGAVHDPTQPDPLPPPSVPLD